MRERRAQRRRGRRRVEQRLDRSDFYCSKTMINLVSNAVRYTARGGVVVGARRRGGVLRLDVWDSGIGIPEDQRRTIFDEFYQLASAQADRAGGLGLGLAIVDRLCGLLDHRIEVSSTLGRGSRFSVVVPLAEAQTEPVAAPAAINLLQDPFRGRLVVVIDDDALSREGLGGLLASWGCRVVMADSVDTALNGSRSAGGPRPHHFDYRLSRRVRHRGHRAAARRSMAPPSGLPRERRYAPSGCAMPWPAGITCTSRCGDAVRPAGPAWGRRHDALQQPTEPVHDPSIHPNAEGSTPAPRP